jgi:hypothetical protein
MSDPHTHDVTGDGSTEYSKYLLELTPGLPVTLLTSDVVINMQVVSVRLRPQSIKDIPADARILGVEIKP